MGESAADDNNQLFTPATFAECRRDAMNVHDDTHRVNRLST
jgi:hypothetical protein